MTVTITVTGIGGKYVHVDVRGPTGETTPDRWPRRYFPRHLCVRDTFRATYIGGANTIGVLEPILHTSHMPGGPKHA